MLGNPEKEITPAIPAHIWADSAARIRFLTLQYSSLSVGLGYTCAAAFAQLLSSELLGHYLIASKA